ncbi:MAG TPA: hypothetical protein VF981_07665 [Gemmatimonadaceae bacterium]
MNSPLDRGVGPLKFALPACGDIGSLRAAAIARPPRMALTGACDIDPSEVESVPGKPPGTAAMADWRQAVTCRTWTP